MKTDIKIKFQNGITYQTAISEILNELTEEYNFIETDDPAFILFGPYGNDIPLKGNYTRIGYFCENIKPDLSICEWAFGIPREQEINNPKYKRIQWHGLNPQELIKNLNDNDIDKIISSKTKFCNFLYSPKPYREAFFKQLSKYKRVDAPGISMNNMHSIDSMYTGNTWERKRRFLSEYKFTIAFENYCYPGYQTEKLYDAMQCDNIPIYCGDPFISEVFNKHSFLNTPDYIKVNESSLISWIEKKAQLDFTDIRPLFYKQPQHRIQRKLKKWAREFKMYWQFNKLDFSPLIDRIIEIDKDPNLYRQYIKEAWFIDNTPPKHLSTKSRWIEIFETYGK